MHYILNISLFLCIYATTLLAAPRSYQYDSDTATILRETRDTIEMLRHEISNHETEMRMMSERIDNQEATIASLRQQILDTNQANKELVRGTISNIDTKMNSLEAANKGLITDMQQLKNHANDSTNVLTQYKQDLIELKKINANNIKNVDNLQNAMKSLTEALQADGEPAKETASNGDSKTYRIKNGDNLEKIARAHHTTVKAIKEVNNLTNDRIIVGQKLLIP